MSTLSSLKPNDIVYTKDGRKSGNLCIIEVIDHVLPSGTIVPLVVAISDYGNIVKFHHMPDKLSKRFFTITGTADSTHKFYNYKLNYPEYSI